MNETPTKMMSRSLLAAILMLGLTGVQAQVIPGSLHPDWSQAGAQNFYIDTTNVADVTAFGATGNGVINDFNAVVNAVASLNGKNGVVYFPAGTYLLNGSLYLQDSVILKGESATNTTLKFNLGGVTGNCINVLKGQTSVFQPVKGGYLNKSDKLIVDSAAAFTAGDYAEIRQDNGPWDTNPVFWAEHSVGQVVRIQAITGDTLYLQKPLRIDYDSALQVEIRKINPRTNCGLECLRIIRTDSTAASVNYGIYFLYAANVRIRGIESDRHIGAHAWAEISTGIEITGSYFHHAYAYDGSSTHGYGVVLAAHTGDSKIENNIFRHLRHAMMVKQGANGNVFSYNYSIEPFRTEFPSDFGADISLHGHYPYANLFEGNIHQNLIADQAWGPSGPHNTFFRNRVELYGIFLTGGVVNSDQQNIAGNDITGTGPLQGQYALGGTGHFEHGNRDNGVIIPAGTSALADTSYYLDSVPAFWNIAQSFPNIGTPYSLAGQTIPARERYLAGTGFMVCEQILPSGLASPPVNDAFSVSVYPVIAFSTVVVSVSGGTSKSISVQLIDVTGGVVCAETCPVRSGSAAVAIETKGMRQGMYVVVVYDGQSAVVKRILKINGE